MGLGEVQRVLAQLYTNAALRERFFADPQGVGEELGLSAAEVQQVGQLSERQIHLFAKSLHSKRLGEITKLLPLTQRVLGKKFIAFFYHYAETYVPKGIKKHYDDAISFATFIEHLACTEGIEPTWVVAVLRYEKAGLVASEVQRRLTVRRFGYAMGKLVQSLEGDDEVPVLVKQPTMVLWVRLTRQGRLQRIVLPLPALNIL